MHSSGSVSKKTVKSGFGNFEFTFTNEQVPDSPVLVAEAWDYKKNTVQNFFNDGLHCLFLRNFFKAIAKPPPLFLDVCFCFII